MSSAPNPRIAAFFSGRIAMRYDDRGRQSGALRGESQRLAVIAARRRDDAFDMRPFAFQPLDVEEASAQLESADRRVIFVFDEDLGADPRAQQRPRILRRRWHGGAYDRQSGFNIAEREHCSLSPRVLGLPAVAVATVYYSVRGQQRRHRSALSLR